MNLVERYPVIVGVLFVVCAIFLVVLSVEFTSFTHESGHALACVLQGGKILSPWHPFIWFKINPGTKCSNLNNPITIVAGSATQLLIWSALMLTVIPRTLRWLEGSQGWLYATMLVVFWSVNCVLEPYMWVRDIHRLPYDSARLVQVTHADPHTVVTLCWISIVILAAVTVPCDRTIFRHLRRAGGPHSFLHLQQTLIPVNDLLIDFTCAQALDVKRAGNLWMIRRLRISRDV